MPHNKTKSWQHCLSWGNCGNTPGSLQPDCNLRFNALLIPVYRLSTCGLGLVKNEELLATELCRDGQSLELAKGELAGFYHPGQTVHEDWMKKWKKWSAMWAATAVLVCCGVTDSWLIFHQKFIVNDLGQSSPWGCPPFKMHSFIELLRVQSHWFLCKKWSKLWRGISKLSLQNSEVSLFTLKFHFESQLHFKWC